MLTRVVNYKICYILRNMFTSNVLPAWHHNFTIKDTHHRTICTPTEKHVTSSQQSLSNNKWAGIKPRGCVVSCLKFCFRTKSITMIISEHEQSCIFNGGHSLSKV